MTQPAVTKNLDGLERAVRSKLFQRNRTGVQLTQAGRLLLVRARGLLRSADEAQRELDEFTLGTIGRLRIGAGPSVAEFLVPQVISELIEKYPKVELTVTCALNNMLFENLRAGNLDIVVSGIPDVAPNDFEQELLMHDKLVVVASLSNPLVRKRNVKLRDLVGETWILPPPQVLARQWIDRQFALRKLPLPRVAVEADSNAAIISIAANTKFITFQPQASIYAMKISSKVAEIEGAELIWRRPIGASWRKGSYIPRIGQQFIASLQSLAGRLSTSGNGSTVSRARRAR
jgi:DNA-binding transcriptional LysR family regulator